MNTGFPKSALRFQPIPDEPAPNTTRYKRAARGGATTLDRPDVSLNRTNNQVHADVLDRGDIHTDEQQEPFTNEYPLRRRRVVTDPDMLTAQKPPQRNFRSHAGKMHQGRKISQRWVAIALIIAGLLIAWVGYSGVWWGLNWISHQNNHWRFAGGPPTTSVNWNGMQAVAINNGRAIKIYLPLNEDHIQILEENLSAQSWNDDTSEVVPSLSIIHGKLSLTLTGDRRYGGLMDILTETFTITRSDAENYQIIRTA